MYLTKNIISLVLCSLALVSCGGGGAKTEILEPQAVAPTGLLVAVSSSNVLLDSMRRGFTQIGEDNTARMSDTLEATTSADAGASFTTTYTLEANVDEHDFVKYDGEHLFIAPSRGMDCCFIVNDALAPEMTMADVIPAETDERSIRILATDPTDASATEVSTIALSDNLSVEGLYTNESQLVAIGSSGWWGGYGDSFTRIANWESQTTTLSVYDITDVTAPAAQMNIEFEGGFVSSRKKGDIVYLVARHTPVIEGFVYYPNEKEKIDNELLLSEISLEDMLPTMTIDGVSSPLVDPGDCMIADAEHELSPATNGYPTMTILIAVNLADRSVAKARCYLEPTDGIYVSENAIYLSQIDYSDSLTESSSRTIIHRFELTENLVYQGSGAAEGSLYLSGDRDFRINEHDGYLRLVTTQRTGDSSDSVDHKLSILKLNTQEVELDLVATLPNSEHPEAIGKPNEALYGVRFMGDVLYLVTFERIDPLYVVNLSNPTDPVIAGELMVTGFSDFLHPVNEELLMGLGQDENGLVKLELFNVADMTAPYSLGGISLGESEGASWGYSEARYNRHAFTYQTIDASKDRFLIPATISFYSTEKGYQDEDRLYMFELNSKDNAALASIDEIGRITAEHEWWQSSFKRSVIHDDAVYYINGSSVWSSLWTNPTEQNGPM
jgi:uncharacterized secreted protein with C-terminal beta-propeller domain